MLLGRKIAYLSAATRPGFVSRSNKRVKRIALAAGYARRYGVANERFWPVAPLANSRFMTQSGRLSNKPHLLNNGVYRVRSRRRESIYGRNRTA
jgi:hypothetical protein